LKNADIDTHLTEEGERVFSSINAPSPSCLKCSHFRVCQIFRTLHPFITQQYLDSKDAPIRVKDLAKICNAYEIDSKFLPREEIKV
jgi:hypothetical protein